MNFDSMSAEEVKTHVQNTDKVVLEEQLSDCSFACLKRTYEKYYGFRPVSTMSKEQVIRAFRRTKEDEAMKALYERLVV